MVEISTFVFIFIVILLVSFCILVVYISINAYNKQKMIDVLKGIISEQEQSIDKFRKKIEKTDREMSSLKIDLDFYKSFDSRRYSVSYGNAVPIRIKKLIDKTECEYIIDPLRRIEMCKNDIYNQLMYAIEASGAVKISEETITDPINMNECILLTGEIYYLKKEN